MKHSMRTLALLLVLCLLVGSLSSCFTFSDWVEPLPELETELGSDSTEESGADDKDPSNPSGLPSVLAYDLTRGYVVDFIDHLETCEELTLAGTDTDAIEAAWKKTEEMYYHIGTQMQVAYVLLCVDETNEEYSEAYLKSSELHGDAYHAYMEVCRTIDQSNSPYRDEFFSDWTESEIQKMREYSKDSADLGLRNDEILVEYRELDLSTQQQEMMTLYREFVQNANQIAMMEGYENYYDYATDSIYERGYGRWERLAFRRYVRDYLPQLIKITYEKLSENINSLGFFQYKVVTDFIFEPYDELGQDYVGKYLDSFDGDTRARMQLMFDSEHSLFTDSANAYPGAFTTRLHEYDTTFCYFGPDYQSIQTVVHEMGHFYAAECDESSMERLDLAETHSQGNEWLLMAFLDQELSSKVYETIFYYQLYEALCTIVVSTIVDEFEEGVYTRDVQDLDAWMQTVCAGYGGIDFLETYAVSDIQMYWKYVVIQSPVYYLSYAVSGVAALSLYTVADTDYEAGQELYCRLVEDADLSNSYPEILAEAGLASPFEDTVYEYLRLLFLN